MISGLHASNEQNFPPSYMKGIWYLFAQLSASSASILFSSGDSDVGGANSKKMMALVLSNYNPPQENGRNLIYKVW